MEANKIIAKAVMASWNSAGAKWQASNHTANTGIMAKAHPVIHLPS